MTNNSFVLKSGNVALHFHQFSGGGGYYLRLVVLWFQVSVVRYHLVYNEYNLPTYQYLSPYINMLAFGIIAFMAAATSTSVSGLPDHHGHGHYDHHPKPYK